MVTSNLQRNVFMNAYCPFGSQAAPRVGYWQSAWDEYGSKPGQSEEIQTSCKMKDSKPTAIVSSNPVIDGGTPKNDQEIQLKQVRQSQKHAISDTSGPQDFLQDDEHDPIRDFIKDHLPTYKAPTDLKDRIRNITSFKRDEL